MKRLFLLILVIAGSAVAQTIYRWTDEEGKRHFSDTPPPPGAAKSVEALGPGATVADEVPPPYETRKAAEFSPVTLFTAVECTSACQNARDFLARRGVPFTEADVGTPEGLAAMQAAAGQDHRAVPVVTIGSQVGKGFQADQWNAMLDAAGYAKNASNPPPQATPAQR